MAYTWQVWRKVAGGGKAPCSKAASGGKGWWRLIAAAAAYSINPATFLWQWPAVGLTVVGGLGRPLVGAVLFTVAGLGMTAPRRGAIRRR